MKTFQEYLTEAKMNTVSLSKQQRSELGKKIKDIIKPKKIVLGLTPSGGDADSCFIDALTDEVGDTAGLQRMLILFGSIMLIGGISWKLKDISSKVKGES